MNAIKELISPVMLLVTLSFGIVERDPIMGGCQKSLGQSYHMGYGERS